MHFDLRGVTAEDSFGSVEVVRTANANSPSAEIVILPVYNPNQADADNDNIGDACDTVVERRGRVQPVAATMANLSPG